MANTNNYVNLTSSRILLNGSFAQRYPVVISTDAQQSLSSLLLTYTSTSELLTLYSLLNMPAYGIIANAFNQDYSLDYMGGVDLETTYTITFAEDGALDFIITWLNADASENQYEELTGSVANIAALVSYINTAISTVTATVDSLVVTITPDIATPNQLVRIQFTNLADSSYLFGGAGVPADINVTLNALIQAVPAMSVNYYAFYVSGDLFYPNLQDNDDTKIAAFQTVAETIEGTNNYADNTKVVFLDTSDLKNYNSGTASLSYKLKQLVYYRSSTALDKYSQGLQLSFVNYTFPQDNGNQLSSFVNLTGITDGTYTDQQVEKMISKTESGISENCNNCNYYNSADNQGPFFYAGGITGSGLPIAYTILNDNIALSLRLGILQMLINFSQTNKVLPQSNSGINLITDKMYQVLKDYFSAGYTQSYDDSGSSGTVSGGSYNAYGVAFGFVIAYRPAGSIDKVYGNLYQVISSSDSASSDNVLTRNRLLVRGEQERLRFHRKYGIPFHKWSKAA